MNIFKDFIKIFSFFLFLIIFIPSVILADSKKPEMTIFSIERSMMIKGYKGYARGYFSGDVQILGINMYADEWKGYISPIDLAVGWGLMMERQSLDELKIKQGNRFYYWQIPEKNTTRWDAKKIITSSTNIHIIPGYSDMLLKILTLRAGDKIHIEGYLVDIEDGHGNIWQTSIKQDDTGAGACEILLVTKINILKP